MIKKRVFHVIDIPILQLFYLTRVMYVRNVRNERNERFASA